MTDRTDATDHWTEHLSGYLDGELPTAEAEALERHLAGCETCARTLEELRAVVERARSLEPSAPPRDLWPAIADRIGLGPGATSLAEARRRKERRTRRRKEERRTRRLLTLSLPQLAAAVIALMVLSGGVVWVATGGSPPGGGPAGGDPGVAAAPGPAAGVTLATGGGPPGAQGSTLARYQAAIADLEQTLFYGGERLDTATVRKIRESLRTIDRAIAEARRALQEDPSDPYVHQHLAETMRRKVEVLQRTAVLAVARG